MLKSYNSIQIDDRQLLEMIWSKMKKKIDNTIEKIDQFEMSASENKIKKFEEEHEELQRGTSFIEFTNQETGKRSNKNRNGL